jgi:hypothetical protein
VDIKFEKSARKEKTQVKGADFRNFPARIAIISGPGCKSQGRAECQFACLGTKQHRVMA